MSGGAPLLLAHRGDHRRSPENTLPAFRAALAVGCVGVELDVRRSADGQAVVVHDATLGRVRGLRLAVRDASAAQLAAHGIPTLAEALGVLPDPAFVDIELKEEDAIEPALAAIDAAPVDHARLAVSSFDPRTLAQVRARRPGLARWQICRTAAEIDGAADEGCGAVALAVSALDRAAMDRARTLGLRVIGWTIRDSGTRDRLLALGVDGLCLEGEALPGGP